MKEEQFTLTIHLETRKKAIDALSAYGNNGIDAINDLMRITVNDEVNNIDISTIRMNSLISDHRTR